MHGNGEAIKITVSNLNVHKIGWIFQGQVTYALFQLPVRVITLRGDSSPHLYEWIGPKIHFLP